MKESSSAAKASVNVEPATLPRQRDVKNRDESFTINCLLRTIRFDNSSSLLSRINYCFPASQPFSVAQVIHHAGCLNALLTQSKIYVVKDIDGDRGHFLQMDSILKGDHERGQISLFLKGVSRDIEILLKYFQKEAYAPNLDNLSALAQRCNQVGLRESVSMVA